ncbi:MAG: hypothetical protein QM767_16060 [Anaeromyxobacter sp.]
MNRSSRSAAPALAALALALPACAPTSPHPWSYEGICSVDVDMGQAADAAAWRRLVLGDRSHRGVRDCTGTPVVWEGPVLQCGDAEVTRAALPARPASEGGEDVVVSDVDPSHKLVWVLTDFLATGDALGPVALVEIRNRMIRVEAIGTLRAYRSAKLRLVHSGGAVVLVAEGQGCAGAGPSTCGRAARLMALSGARFQQSQLVDAGGSCLGAGWVQLQREEYEGGTGGRERVFRLDASVAGAPDGLKLTELVTVHDRDPRRPEAPEKLVRRAESTAVYRVNGANLAGEAGPLWARMAPAPAPAAPVPVPARGRRN